MISSASKPTPHKYEAVFSLFLFMVAFLYRDNSHLVYPQILYLFLIFLLINLGASYALTRWGEHPWMSIQFILANCATITAILNYSGKEQSNLWVLFLLPIFTVSMLLHGREIVWITIGVLSFNWVFHQFSVGRWTAEMVFLMSFKSGIFIFAAVATGTMAQRDKKSRERFLVQKNQLEELESQLHEQDRHLSQIEKMADIGELSAGIAHDLNNPIAVINGTVKILLEDNPPDPLKSELERINRAGELCRTITHNLLDFTKKQEIKTVPEDMNQVIESVLEMFENELNQNAIKIDKHLGKELPPVALSQPHFERVLLNLFANAKAAMPKGGTITLTTDIYSGQFPDGNTGVQVVVDDAGTGIPPAAMEKLFKPFNTTKGPEGTGLGLYLSREIISKHNGLMYAANRPEGGARFTILLPAYHPAPAA